MSDFGSSIKIKKRIILKNPDGSYSHCFKTGEKDSIADQKENIILSNNQVNNMEENALDNLTISDSELVNIINNYDQYDHNSLLDYFVSEYRRNQIIFLFILIMEMGLTCFLLILTWDKKETSILKIGNTYKDLNSNEASLLFNVIYGLIVLTNFVFYPLGFYSVITKKVKIFKFFSHYALYSSVLMIFIMYLNIMFAVLFVLRLLVYGFSKFILNLLIAILLLPRHPANYQIAHPDYGTL